MHKTTALRGTAASLAAFLVAAAFSPVESAEPNYDPNSLPAAVTQIGASEFSCNLDEAVNAFGYFQTPSEWGSVFYAVPCFTADINLESFVVEIDQSGSAWLHSFAESPDGGRTELVINPAISDGGRQITVEQFYGPNGSCGRYGRYRYDADRGGYLIMEQREKTNCGGDYQPPQSYPLTWSAE